MTNLVKWLFEKTKKQKKIAVSTNNEKITHNKLYREIKRFSTIISNLVGENNNILLVSDNSIFFIISYLSIIGSGNVCIPLKYDKNLELNKIKKISNSSIIFIQEKYKDILNNISFEKVFDENISKKDHLNKILEFQEYSPEKLAAIIFTSGSTSEPKGVMISHSNFICNTKSIIEGLSINKEDKIMVVLPFYYCFGASLLHTHLREGAEIILNNNFLFPQKIVDELVTKKCTGIAGVPTIFQILLRKTKIKQMKFPHLRCVQQAGGKLANFYLNELIEVFGEEKIFVMYGQTEATARLSILSPKYLKLKLGSIGKGLNGTELIILDSDGKEARPGELGEIYAKGGNIMIGYLNNEKETKEKLKKGMLKTGDLGKKDEEGFIFLTGRKSDFIKSRGHRVSIKKIEEIISEIPEIVEVAVVGADDSLFGEKIICYISTNQDILKNEILSYCSKRLQNYEVPAQIIILPELPKNQSLKIDYVKLKKKIL